MSHAPVTNADPKEMKKATEMWERFTKVMAQTVISVAVLLVLMVIFLI